MRSDSIERAGRRHGGSSCDPSGLWLSPHGPSLLPLGLTACTFAGRHVGEGAVPTFGGGGCLSGHTSEGVAASLVRRQDEEFDQLRAAVRRLAGSIMSQGKPAAGSAGRGQVDQDSTVAGHGVEIPQSESVDKFAEHPEIHMVWGTHIFRDQFRRGTSNSPHEATVADSGENRREPRDPDCLESSSSYRGAGPTLSRGALGANTC